VDECESEPQIEERITLAMAVHECLTAGSEPSCENFPSGNAPDAISPSSYFFASISWAYLLA
jgi:hypothetical protein